MKCKKNILFIVIVFSMLIFSCKSKEKEISIESKIQQIVITNLLKNDSTLVMRNQQGSFSIINNPSKDTSTLFYSGFCIGSVFNVDTISNYSNVQFNIDTILFNMRGKLSDDFIELKEINFLKRFIKNKNSSKNIVTIDWNKLQKMGYNNFITISQLMEDKKNKIGFIGIQKYTEKECEIIIKIVDLKNNNFSLQEFWKVQVDMLEYKCIFNSNEIISISPYSFVLKSKQSFYSPGKQ